MKKAYTLVELATIGAIVLILCGCIFMGCNSQYAARRYGGTTTVTLNHGEKLVNITWKDSSLWYLTRSRKKDEAIETYTFHEDSVFGVMAGTVVVKEQE